METIIGPVSNCVMVELGPPVPSPVLATAMMLDVLPDVVLAEMVMDVLALMILVLVALFPLVSFWLCTYSRTGIKDSVFSAKCVVPKNTGDTELTFRIRVMNVKF